MSGSFGMAEHSSSGATSSDDENFATHSHAQLELRFKVDRCFGITRSTGLAWFEAARYGDLAAMRKLIAEREAADRDAKAPMRSGIDATRVQRLVNYNGQATSYGFIGSTALHWACANGDVAMATLLLKKGASVNIQNFGGSTALHSAASNGQPEMVELLLRHGANSALVDVCGDTPADVIREDAPMKDRRRILILLKAQALVSQLLLQRPEQWKASDMTTVLVAVAAYPSVDAVPKERAALQAACAEALTVVRQVRSAAAAADERAALLQAKANKRIEKERARMAARAADDDDDDDGDADVHGASSAPVPGAAAADAKEKGNAAFAQGDWKSAVRWYTTAISMNSTDATYYSNRAAAYTKLGQWSKALADGRSAVALKPDWPKAHHRVGAAALGLGRYDEAAAAFRAGLQLCPGDAVLAAGLAEAEQGLLRDAASDDPSDDDDVPRPTATQHGTTAAPAGGFREAPPPAPPAVAPAARKPWFDCVLCENKTRDHAASPCCQQLVCGTCVKRRFGSGCPLRCGR